MPYRNALPTALTLAAALLAAPMAFAQEAAAAPAGGFAAQLLMRWAHILAAIVMLGGGIFLRFVLLPAATATLDPDTHAKLRAEVRRRWAPFVHAMILLFLVSGFYNYLAVTRILHPDTPLYHALFGVKFLLALAIFFLATLLAGRSGLAQKLQANARLWMALVVLLGLAVAAIGGVMKSL